MVVRLAEGSLSLQADSVKEVLSVFQHLLLNKGSDIVFQLQPILPTHQPPTAPLDFESFLGRCRVDFESRLKIDSKI